MFSRDAVRRWWTLQRIRWIGWWAGVRLRVQRLQPAVRRLRAALRRRFNPDAFPWAVRPVGPLPPRFLRSTAPRPLPAGRGFILREPALLPTFSEALD